MADDFPPSTPEEYDWITLPAPIPTQTWHHRAKETYSSDYPSRTTFQSPSPTTLTPNASASVESQMLWDKVAHGAKVAIVLSAVLGMVVIVLASAWYCCNCCGMRKRRRAQQTAERNGVLPMHTIQNRGVERAATTRRQVSDAPPSYEEAVPPQHQRLAGGIRATAPTSEEDDAVVSDGKTPLSEIPFEDVVLDHVSSQSSGSRGFDQVHHGAGGDTRGHTNS